MCIYNIQNSKQNKASDVLFAYSYVRFGLLIILSNINSAFQDDVPQINLPDTF